MLGVLVLSLIEPQLHPIDQPHVRVDLADADRILFAAHVFACAKVHGRNVTFYLHLTAFVGRLRLHGGLHGFAPVFDNRITVYPETSGRSRLGQAKPLLLLDLGLNRFR